MKITLELVDIVFEALQNSAIKNSITGSICKHRRDGNSDKEDVVINGLTVNNAQLQNGIVNVNVHVPDLVVNVNGMDDKQPNHVRLQDLAELTVSILNENVGAGYYFDVQQQNLLYDEAEGHYVNIRIEFIIENL